MCALFLVLDSTHATEFIVFFGGPERRVLQSNLLVINSPLACEKNGLTLEIKVIKCCFCYT